jgi:hypothetical protein
MISLVDVHLQDIAELTCLAAEPGSPPKALSCSDTTIRVSIIPGAYALTVMLCSDSSSAGRRCQISYIFPQYKEIQIPVVCVRARIAAFDMP